MASIYSQAIGQSAKIMDEKVKAAGQAQKQGVDAQSFTLDKTEEFNKQATKARDKYGKWKKAFSVIAGGAATLMGLGPLAAAALTATGTFAGGKIGEAKAGKDLTSKWMKGNQAALKEGMKAQTISSAITSGVMAGVSAKMAGGKTPADGTAVEGAGEVAKAPSKYVKSAKQNKSLASEIGIDTSKFKGNENLESVFNKKIEAGDFAEGIKGQSGATYDIGKATSWDTLTDSTKEKIFHAGEHTKLGTEHIAGKIPGLDKEFAGLSPEYGYKNIFKSDAGIGRQMQSNLANTLQGWGNLAKVGQNNTLMTMAFGYGMGRNTNRNQGY